MNRDYRSERVARVEMKNGRRVLAVVVAIGISWAFVLSDSATRYLRIITSMSCTMGTSLPNVDPTSMTGYELGMRRVILPPIGADGCHWIMHTQKMLHDGGWRIRFTDNDNAPDGREIHWSHSFIWWLIILGKIHSTITGLPLPASVEVSGSMRVAAVMASMVPESSDSVG